MLIPVFNKVIQSKLKNYRGNISIIINNTIKGFD